MADKAEKGKKKNGPHRLKFTTNGRPSKRTPQLEKTLLGAIRTGAPYRIACMACGISEDVFANWRRSDPVFARTVEEASGQTALRLLKKIEAQGEQNFSALAWLLERRFPETFSRPEVQLNLIQQHNTIENSLTIHITAGEAAGIEAAAEPIRESVRKRFAAYRPQSLGNGESVHEVEAEPVEPQAAEPTVITHRGENDAQDSAFWKLLVTSNPDSLVRKETAVFAIRAVLVRIQGYKGHRTEINFRNDPITLSDLLAVLEKLSGGSGWREMNSLAGY